VSGAGDWAARRRADAAAQGERLERDRRREADAAAALLAAFVADAAAAGLAPQPLRARSWSGRRTYRTPLRGWYLRLDRSCAVGEDGRFHLLSVPDSLRAAVRGVDVPASEPVLVLGRGSRDGDSVTLADVLARALADGAAGP
jgi:hypothetical protein